MQTNFIQPGGNTTIQSTGEIFSQLFNIPLSSVGSLEKGTDITLVSFGIHPETKEIFNIGTATGVVSSVVATETGATITSSTGTFTVQSLPQQLTVLTLKSVSELRSFKPLFEGQIVNVKSYYLDGVVGGGTFQGSFTVQSDDDGHLFTGTGYTWTRINVKEINLYDYGIYLQSGATVVSTPTSRVDMSDKMNAAIARSIAMKVPLQSPFYLGNDIDFVSNGILLLKSVRFDGIKNALGDYPFLSYGTIGSYTSDPGLAKVTGVDEPFVVFNLNADFDANGAKYYGTNRGGQRFGKVVVYNLGGRNVHLNGQLHITKNTTFECLHGSQLLGTAVNMGTSFDYQIKELGAHTSGDYNYFAIDASIYPAADNMDEHNAYTIESLFAHDCWEHSVRVLGSKGNIVRVHEEATRVSSTTDYAGYGSTYGSINGYGYTTSMLGGTGSVIGAYSVQAHASSTNPVVAQMTMYGTTFNNVYGSNAVNFSVVAQNNAANAVNALKSLQGGLIVNDQGRTTFGTVNLLGNLAIKDTRSTIGSLIITGDVTDCYGTIVRANVTGNLTVHPIGNVDYSVVSGNLTINQGWAGGVYVRNSIVTGNLVIINGGGTTAWLENVVIRANFTSSNGSNLRLTNFRVDGTTLLAGTSLSIEFMNAQFGVASIDAAATGTWLFDLNCKATTFTGYIAPTTAPRAGAITKNMQTGEVQIRLGTAWKILIAAPA